MDYTNWILYESKGAVKLNKVARQILSTYVPFPASICEDISTNGAFTEVMRLYNLKKKQQYNIKYFARYLRYDWLWYFWCCRVHKRWKIKSNH